MASIHETAYPRLNPNPRPADLEAIFTPTLEELDLTQRVARTEGSRLGFLITLKVFQRLGQPACIRDVPPAITEHILRCLGFLFIPTTLATYDASSTRTEHLKLIRAFLGIRPFNLGGEAIATTAMTNAAQTKEDLRDLINVALEELARQRFELPGFTTLLKEAQRVRAQVNSSLQQRVHGALQPEECQKLWALLVTPGRVKGHTQWQDVKREPGKASLQNLKLLVAHHAWLLEQCPTVDLTQLLPDAKRRQFATEAEALDAQAMKDLEVDKRFALAAVLVITKTASVLDDLGNLFIKRLSSIQQSAKDALERHHLEQRQRVDALIRTLGNVVTAYQTTGSMKQRLESISSAFGEEPSVLLERCEQHLSLSGNNFLPFLWQYYVSHRAVLFDLARNLCFRATSADTSTLNALRFIVEHHHRRSDTLEVNGAFDVHALLTDKWWPLVVGHPPSKQPIASVYRKHLEICVFICLWQDLKAGDVCIEGSLEFADYREQLVDDTELDALLPQFAEEVGLPVDPDEFIAHLKTKLDSAARAADDALPGNDTVRLDGGRPVVKPLKAKPLPSDAAWLDKEFELRLGVTPILDAVADVENLLNTTRFFGPLSGFEGKLPNARERYLTAAFCYGCQLGPAETARAVEGVNADAISWVNKHHITGEDLDNATTLVVNAYNKFALPRFWGSGRTVSADGMKWDVYEQNLLSEYHIRYGGYGGMGYYHVSDTYIALFSRFVPCGVYEGIYILDPVFENKSDLQPDTIHSDTHGQSEAVHGLAQLLSIEVLSRINNWAELTFYRPDTNSRYAHIDALFTDVIDWDLLRVHVRDLLRIAVSIRNGRISASTVLKRLSSYSRKNSVYLAFRELGRAVRTAFLLRYMTDVELRSSIQGAMNKSEQFNEFLKWVAFGAEKLESNDREVQQKMVKYNQLVANMLIFHTVLGYTRVLKELSTEGYLVREAVLERLSPYRTEHLNRRGKYRLDLSRVPPEPDYAFEFGVGRRSKARVKGGSHESR
jgi:TnpA family transposase